jgi:hypothetical protein
MKKTKKALAPMKGLVIHWKDRAKDLDKAEIFGHKTTHKNPVYRLMAQDIFNRAHKMMAMERRFHWLIEVAVVFEYPNGITQRSSEEFNCWCFFAEVAASCVQIHSRSLLEGNEEFYTHTEFNATCLEV